MTTAEEGAVWLVVAALALLVWATLRPEPAPGTLYDDDDLGRVSPRDDDEAA